MKWLIIPAAAGALTLAAAYAAVRVGCYVPPRREADVFSMPDTEQYNVFRAQSEKMIRDALSVPYENVFITSFDGLRLHAKFYAAPDPKAPVQIMFHGYKSAAERDFCGGLREGIDGGFNVLLVDQRAHGESEGKYLTFGVNERFDCLSWANYATERFGRDVKIYLYGISMGAATVLMASALPLPDSVSGIVADCGYTSPKDIIFPSCAIITFQPRPFTQSRASAQSSSAALTSTPPPRRRHSATAAYLFCSFTAMTIASCPAA